MLLRTLDAAQVRAKKENSKKPAQECAYEMTVNLSKALHGVTRKRKAARAVTAIKKRVQQMLGTNDVRVDVNLNRALWKAGCAGPPPRIRINVQRKRNADEDAKEPLFCLVSHVPCERAQLKGSQTVKAK